MGAAILSWYPDPYEYNAIKNTRRPSSLGIRYVMQGMKAPVLWSALVCGVYTATECTMEQLRDEANESTYGKDFFWAQVRGSLRRRILLTPLSLSPLWVSLLIIIVILVNSAVAGAAAGMVMGSMSKRIDIMATSALGLGMLMGMVEYNGQSAIGDAEHANRKWNALLPAQSKASTTVTELKETYPEFKDL